MSAEVILLVRMGRALIIPKYQLTKPTLETDADEEEDEEEEEQNEEEKEDGESLYSLVFLAKHGNRKEGTLIGLMERFVRMKCLCIIMTWVGFFRKALLIWGFRVVKEVYLFC